MTIAPGEHHASIATLTIIPEDVDYRMEAMQTDQGREDRAESQIIATAVVARASMIVLLAKLCFSCFPQLQRVLVTDDEQEVRAWLDAQRKGASRTGS